MHHNMARKKVSAAGDKPRPFRCPAELPNKWRGGTATVPHSTHSLGPVRTRMDPYGPSTSSCLPARGTMDSPI